MKIHRRRRAVPKRSTASPRVRSLSRRSGTLETLERREMLAGDVVSGWHNTLNPQDVNFDQRVNSSDLLAIFNDLLQNGSRALSTETATPLSALSGGAKPKFIDVTGDGRVNSADALAVINNLLTEPQMRVTTIVTDMVGNEITEVSVGTQYKLMTIVQDVRNPPADPVFQGVFSAAADIHITNSELSSIDTGQDVEFGEFFNLPRSSTLAQDRIIGFASTTDVTAPGTDPQFLFSVVLTAVAEGTQTFTPTYDTTDLDHLYLLYGIDDSLPPENVEFIGDTLEILALPSFSIADVSQSETNANSNFVFTVSLSEASSEQATVQYATSNGTATAGSDYTATSGTLTFSPGQTSAVITVNVIGDTDVEPDEVFNVSLSNPSSNATISTATAQGTILNDDVIGSLSIAGTTVQNVTAGTTTAEVTVTLTSPPATAVTVQYTTANNSAFAGVDYTAASGTLTFTPGGSLTQVIPITILGDPNPDNAESFFVNLSNASPNAQIDVGQATVTIDPAVSGISVSVQPNIAQIEGNSGSTFYVFTVSLNGAAGENVTVGYSTQDDSATAGQDYLAASGTLTFSPGQTSQTISVEVLGDTNPEPNETFTLNLGAVTGPVSIGVGAVTGTIQDDDSTATLSISDATVAAGSSLTQAFFTVTLTGAITETITVGYATSDGSASAGVDYLQATGNLMFQPGGERTKVIPVTVLGSTQPKPDQTFFMNLSSVTPPGVVLDDDLGIATIVTQGLSISDAVVVEGNAGTRTAVFTVSLSRQLNEAVTVAYATSDLTATLSDGDYQQAAGTLTFAPGSSEQLITVLVNGDVDVEANETFRVVLSGAVNSPVFNGTGTGTIINDDGNKVAYRLALADESGVELPLASQLDVGEEFYLQVFVQDVQAAPQGVAQAFIDVMYEESLIDVVPGSLEFGEFYDTFQFSDFQPGLLNDFGAFGDIVSPPENPGEELLLYQVRFVTTDNGLLNFVGSVDEDDLEEDSETLLYGGLVQPVPSSQITVVDRSINIGANVIAVASSSADESDGTIVFTVTRFLPTAETATVVFNTQDGTAIAGSDYTAQSGTLTFDALNPVRFVTVTVLNDLIDEPDENFSLVLSDPQGAEISGAAGTGIIVNDDDPPTVSIAGAAAPEGTGIVFNVTLGQESGKTVTVVYNTVAGGTATAGVDYTPVSGTLTFAPGTTQQSVTVPTLSDIQLEANETFQLVISDPTNATLGTAQASGTIIDVPPAGISGYVYVDSNGNGLKDVNESGIQGSMVTATNIATGAKHTVATAADGSYALLGLVPGEYELTQQQPGFYTDGRDTRFGIDSPYNDRFVGINLAPSEAESGYNFGEGGIRPDFITAFFNRRVLFAGSVVSGMYPDMGSAVLDLRGGELWVSFDGGWDGLREIQASFDAAEGPVSMKLYNYDLQQIAVSGPTSGGVSLFYNGTLGETYFLRITGSNPNVTVEISDPPAINLSTPDGESGDSTPPPVSDPPPSSTTSGGASRFAIGLPMTAPPDADPLVADDNTDEALADEEDWLLESLLS